MNNYKGTIDYLYAQLPMFQKIGAKAYKASLSNSITLDNHLNNPHKKFKSIHIAGTNGKGSTAHMIAAVLQVAGYKVGIYTSPHLKDFRERIKINGKPVSTNFVVDFVRKHHYFFEKLQPSFFEITVAMAFSYFAYKKVDIAVIEVGLGGRIDSTNIINPILSVITNIGLEHTNFLGNTLPKIATEKAGIIKKNIPTVIGETNRKTKDVFLKFAEIKKSKLIFADKRYSIKSSSPEGYFNIFKNGIPFIENIYIDLLGSYQRKNMLTAIASLNYLNQLGFIINTRHIQSGFSQIISLTGLKGRWQILNRNPLTIADIAHNEMGLKLVFEQVKTIKYKNLYIIFGLSDGKDIENIMNFLLKDAYYCFVKAKNIKRGISTSLLAKFAEKNDLKYDTFDSVRNAYNTAKQKAQKDDMVLITGSTFIVSEMI